MPYLTDCLERIVLSLIPFSLEALSSDDQSPEVLFGHEVRGASHEKNSAQNRNQSRAFNAATDFKFWSSLLPSFGEQEEKT